MKSPFPGMDPYLEARWSDVHVTLLGIMKEALQPLLPSDLRARSADLDDGPEVDRFVQIIDVTNGNRVVTAIEVLSPWNKAADRLNEDYRRKLDNYGRAEVNVVEIDLLRIPRGRLPVGQEDLPPEHRAPYLACVRRATMPSRWELYPISLRRPVPRFPVPLRRQDEDVILDLQPLIERVYVGGGHDDIDYRRPPVPPLRGDDAAWADELLKSAGLR